MHRPRLPSRAQPAHFLLEFATWPPAETAGRARARVRLHEPLPHPPPEYAPDRRLGALRLHVCAGCLHGLADFHNLVRRHVTGRLHPNDRKHILLKVLTVIASRGCRQMLSSIRNRSASSLNVSGFGLRFCHGVGTAIDAGQGVSGSYPRLVKGVVIRVVMASLSFLRRRSGDV